MTKTNINKNHRWIKRLTIIAIISVTVILSSSIYLASAIGISDVFQIGDDGGFHIGRIQTIADDIMAGQFPDKMYMSMSAGMGYPAGIMYPDLFLYPFAFLRILGVPLLYCVLIFIVSTNILTALISYFVAKNFFSSTKIACVVAVLYTLSPYRLYCIFTRFSSGELIALAFIPLVVVCLYNIITYNTDSNKVQNKQWVGLAIGMAGIVYSHVLSAVILAEFLAIPIIVILIIKRDAKCFLALVKAALLCLLLCLAFIVPFIDYFLQYESGMAKGDMSLWYILSYPDRENYFSFNNQFRSGWVIYSALVLWPIVFFAKTKQVISKKAKVFGWFLFGFALIFLLFIKAEFIWAIGDSQIPIISSIIQHLASIQFPWRLYGPMIVCLVFLMGVCLYVLKKYSQFCQEQGKTADQTEHNKNNTTYIIFQVIVISSILLSMIIAALYPLNIVRPKFQNTQDYFTNYVPEADDLYLPMYDRDLKDSAFLNDWIPLEDRIDKANPNVTFSNSTQYGTTIYTHAQNMSADYQQVDIPLVCYPYVKVIDANTKQEFDTEKNWWSAFINITLPPNYSGDLICGFVKPAFWTIAEIISLITLICLIGFTIRSKLKQDLSSS